VGDPETRVTGLLARARSDPVRCYWAASDQNGVVLCGVRPSQWAGATTVLPLFGSLYQRYADLYQLILCLRTGRKNGLGLCWNVVKGKREKEENNQRLWLRSRGSQKGGAGKQGSWK
jgi:hypothetical protein